MRLELSCAPGVAVSTDVRRTVRRALGRAAARLGVDGAVRLRFMGVKEMTDLHEMHMGERKVTDVLSFPAATGPEDPSQTAAHDSPSEPDLGDLALCWPEVRKQAGLYGADPRHEAVVLAIHGLVHLLGHDHRDRRTARAMHRLERRGLAAAGFPDVPRPYTSPAYTGAKGTARR